MGSKQNAAKGEGGGGGVDNELEYRTIKITQREQQR